MVSIFIDVVLKNSAKHLVIPSSASFALALTLLTVTSHKHTVILPERHGDDISGILKSLGADIGMDYIHLLHNEDDDDNNH